MSKIACVVAYPSTTKDGAATKFDMDYYLKSHMPLVMDTWGKHGLQKWSVIKLGPGPDGSKPQFAVQALMTFKDEEALKSAMGDAGTKAVFDDVPKFTNKSPIFLAGGVVGSS